MADPPSISVSIAGLVTLADEIYRTASKYAKSVKNARQEIADLATEKQELAGVLHRLSLIVSALDIERDVDDDNVQVPVLRLDHILPLRNGKTRDKVAMALKWPCTSIETKEILAGLVRQKSTLSLALAADTMTSLLQSLTPQERMQGQLDDLGGHVKETLQVMTNIKLDDERRRVFGFFMTTNPQQSLTQSLSLRHMAIDQTALVYYALKKSTAPVVQTLVRRHNANLRPTRVSGSSLLFDIAARMFHGRRDPSRTMPVFIHPLSLGLDPNETIVWGLSATTTMLVLPEF
ncbi:hypothetical protein B0T14DRAFT_561642 [Immersiella caudata]|uniref:Fungal N-terminal domain-containing protein n=1 Tax=Immersiella caudata TaxID=314043 RepID=A0AA39XHK6_9PEZI|nr:hypothetical protein B0T14DRAFT_561642 [Immersiella caudata]